MKKKHLLYITIPLLGVLCTTVAFLLLPFICDRFLLPSLLKNLPYSEKEFSLSRISPWLVRGTLTLADEGRPILAIPRFEVHARPGDLLRGRISRLLIDSASLEVDMRSGSPRIHGLPLPSTSSEQDSKKFALLPVGVDAIDIRNFAITLRQGDDRFLHLTVDSRLELLYSDLKGGEKQPTGVHGRLQLKGDLNLAAKGSASAIGDGYEINILADPMDLSQFRLLMPAMQQLSLGGALSVAAGARFDGQGNLETYQTTAQLSRFRLTNGPTAIENSDPEQPVLLMLTGDPARTKYVLTNIAFTKPEHVAVDLEGQIDNIEGAFSGEAKIYPEQTHSLVKIAYLGQTAASATRVEYQLESEPMSLGDNLKLSPIVAEGEIQLSDSTITGYFNGRTGSVSLPSSNLVFADVALQLPFTFPADKKTNRARGKFSVGTIKYRSIPSGRLQAKIEAATDSIEFTSLLSTPLASGLQLSCTGSFSLAKEFSLGCRLPETFIDQSVLSPYIDAGEELAFGGRISAALNFNHLQGVQTGDLTVGFHDGSFNQGPNRLSDINLDVTFPRLPLLQSGPGQLCTIGQAEFGNIRLTNGQVRFRVEDEQTVFLEKSKFNWCSGRVETTSFTVSSKMKELEATLYCDRLKFTELLSQFGIDDAEGEGSLNGRLPLLISSEGVVLDDGFLFSTPGNSGIIRFNNTAQLRQGVPSIDQSAYLDYSMRALENFSYNWTKLTFNSELDQLFITMQLDGKPAEPLPFGYRNGTIVPTDKGPGLDHPIRLDVNFRLPLQEMFQYGKNIQSIMENM
jgi:hypothetical protein